MSKNNNLNEAKKAKDDEFYTRYEDIAAEVPHYADQLKGKKVLCNCNDEDSQFNKYFTDNFETLGLADLKCVRWYDDEEGIKALEECDVVITNPPFSKFRDYVALLMEYEKKFLIIGSENCYTYKEIFPFFMRGKMHSGINNVKKFNRPDGSVKEFGNVRWFTNMIVPDKEPIKLTKTYSPEKYPKYDNYDAINVDRVADIPKDYYGVMGVPITFLNKYNPNQFETLKCSAFSNPEYFGCEALYVDDKKKYARIMIKRNDEPQFEVIGCSYSYGEPEGYHKEGAPYGASIDGKELYKRLFIKRNDEPQFEILGLDDDRVEWRGKGPELNGKTLYRRVIIKRSDVEEQPLAA